MDNGQLLLGEQATFFPTGVFTDTAEFSTTQDGPVMITVAGHAYVQCTGGRGANCLYQLTDIASIKLTDSSGNEVGPPDEIPQKSLGRGIGGNYAIWTLDIAVLPMGDYVLTVDGNAHSHTKIAGTDHPSQQPYSILVDGQ